MAGSGKVIGSLQSYKGFKIGDKVKIRDICFNKRGRYFKFLFDYCKINKCAFEQLKTAEGTIRDLTESAIYVESDCFWFDGVWRIVMLEKVK